MIDIIDLNIARNAPSPPVLFPAPSRQPSIPKNSQLTSLFEWAITKGEIKKFLNCKFLYKGGGYWGVPITDDGK